MERIRPSVLLLGVWAVAFTLSCRLGASAAARAAGGGNDAWLDIVLGGSRNALAADFFKMADEYFHRGAEAPTHSAVEGTLLADWAGRVTPRAHVHVHGLDSREIMPWLQLTILLNPSDVNAHLVAAFWLSSEIRRPDLAHEVLRAARRGNPRSYAVFLEEGRLYLHENAVADAKRCFDAGLSLWPGGQDALSSDARMDRASLLLYRALIHEAHGQAESAVADLEQILSMFPDRTYLRERIAALRSGQTPSRLAPDLWSAMVREAWKSRAACDRESGSHAAHDHDDHD